MLRIIKVEGESMSPEYHDGDYVITLRPPFFSLLIKINSVLVFHSKTYGLLIKKVTRIDRKNKKYFFSGTSMSSITTEKIGAVDENDIIGRVLFHFKK